MTLVHGDDYVSSGPGRQLDWMDAQLGTKYTIKSQRLREPVQGKAVEARVLNRILRRTGDG